ncbi:MAG: hypothetical protein IPL59_26645 [Candidatus Competibacteraceae bacterium]|nr:hypothetical protein [Candidatus Competibacteraceae bacterium]
MKSPVQLPAEGQRGSVIALALSSARRGTPITSISGRHSAISRPRVSQSTVWRGGRVRRGRAELGHRFADCDADAGATKIKTQRDPGDGDAVIQAVLRSGVAGIADSRFRSIP